jgi:type VI secretion system secreted protein VgrG
LGNGPSRLAIRLELEALSGAEVAVTHFEVEEALDEPYLAAVTLRISDPDADPVELLGSNAALVLERHDRARRICGIVRAVWEAEPDLDVITARLELAPALWALSLRRDTRIFQEKTAPEILDAVLNEALGEYGRSARMELSATYPKREYCVQYQETDLDFVHRLMEEEGISYAFDHEGDVEVMVLRDANAAFARAPGAEEPLEIQSNVAQAHDLEVLHAFERRHVHATTSVVLREFDWTLSSSTLEDEQRAEDARGRDRESYEHGHGRTLTLSDYDAGARRYQAHDAARQKLVRQEAHRARDVVGLGLGRVAGFAPGTTFEVMGHETVGVDGEYLVTRVRHASLPAGGDREAEPYHNRFECIPLAVPYRPARRTPKPNISSIQTATVTGPAGEEIHTDEHGRIKVRFHWDRVSPADETSSCWIRCEQAWAGAGWGFFWQPRVGMEVVVHFVNGDPDRPLVTGCVYNGANALPYPLPDEKTKSTIKSNSSPGGGGSNELRFEDKAGSEEIFTHAQKDQNEVVENDHTTLVHHDQTIEVDNDQRQTIGNDQTETVHGDQDLSVGGNRRVHVQGNFDETVDGTETRTVTGDVSETFDANETRSIGAAITEDISGNETRSIGASHTETINASHTLTVSGSSTRTVSGALTQTITGGLTTTTPASYNITAVGGFNVTAPAGITMTAPAGITILAPGGVTWIDESNDWFGNASLGLSGFKNEDFCGFMLTLGTTQIGAAGVKFEVALIEIGNAGAGQRNWAVELLAKAAEAKGGTLGKKLKAIICKGC